MWHRANMRSHCIPHAVMQIRDFSLLRASEFFVFRKMKMPEIINHPLCGCIAIMRDEKLCAELHLLPESA